jgi:NADPH:quinone reductase-like Zn-dependent oxidoreductase
MNSPLSDAELATFSCSYSTAEGMLTRAGVTEADTVLVPGASGGVGGALVQLAKRRGARVIALASEAKHADVAALGPDASCRARPTDLRAALEGERITVVADVVGGPAWPGLIDILERGGRYVCSGAIAGPMVTLDLRTFYLRDLTFTGSTVIDPEVMPNLVRYIEAGEIRPALAATYPLEELRAAQAAFIEKRSHRQHRGDPVNGPSPRPNRWPGRPTRPGTRRAFTFSQPSRRKKASTDPAAPLILPPVSMSPGRHAAQLLPAALSHRPDGTRRA